ncbi:venom acid phosphatase isoform X2 [Halictus rubicundus]|uniref:venom acid phosphatase isoform X2 n=1 Tax=Halictus rubicundus TaxID=77578 RepID=UPI004036EAC8
MNLEQEFPFGILHCGKIWKQFDEGENSSDVLQSFKIARSLLATHSAPFGSAIATSVLLIYIGRRRVDSIYLFIYLFQTTIYNMVRFNDYRTSSSMYTIIGLAAVICVGAVQAELRQVSVLFRHGDRAPDDTPLETYPNDPYLNYDFYPEGRGQLTNQGKRREFQLGKVLHERYSAFLGDLYTPQSVSGLSSDYDRTKMSLQLVLAALFPPNSEQKWNPRLNWQPIPTRYLLRVEDNIFLPDDCPLYLAEYDRVLQSTEGKIGLSKFSNFMRQLTVWSGKNITTPLDMYYLYHTLMAEYSLGLPLPPWTREIFPDGELLNGTVFAYNIASATPELKKLYAGPYLRLVTRTMLDFVTGTSVKGRKLYLYSGHETNIAALLHALDLYKPHVPAYSSSVILELHEINNEFYVKVLHYLGIPSKVEELTLPNCEDLCPLDMYLKIIEHLIPTQEELVCNKQTTMPTPSDAEVDLTRFNTIVAARTSEMD